MAFEEIKEVVKVMQQYEQNTKYIKKLDLIENFGNINESKYAVELFKGSRGEHMDLSEEEFKEIKEHLLTLLEARQQKLENILNKVSIGKDNEEEI